MIDLEREQPVTLAEAPRLIPAINAVPGMETRKPLHPRTLYNWARHGKRGVVLETVPVGGILVTSREALGRFFARLAFARQERFSEEKHEKGRRRTLCRRHRDMVAARQRLTAEHGI